MIRFSILILLLASPPAAQIGPPDVVLQGDVHSGQNQTYIEVPFAVPEGTHRITVVFHNFVRDQHTVLDLGIADPFRFRGASGGNKDHFTISETDATPSYLPGAIPGGEWKLLIAVPNIRPNVSSHWQAEIWFNDRFEDSSFSEEPLRTTPGWYRGDLHIHTGHSDGSCASQARKPVPCPLFLTAEAGVRRGLDFIAISDHNTISQYNAERELQPYFDKLLLIPGRELTTFHGHANVFGTTSFIDYRVPDTNSMLRQAQALGAIVSINHPEAPSGENCMGCGWTPASPIDMKLITAIEVINGTGPPATHLWDEQLHEGHRLTAIGGSDNHHADWPVERSGAVGYPATVVYARSLSVPDIIAGIRSGRVFIDIAGSSDRVLDLAARTDSTSSGIGGDLKAQAGEDVALALHVVGCPGGSVHLLVDGRSSPDLPSLAVASGDQLLNAHWQSDGKRHWIRAEVYDTKQHLVLFGNPLYVNFGTETPH